MKGGGVVLLLVGGIDVYGVELVIILGGGVEIQKNTSYSTLYPSLGEPTNDFIFKKLVVFKCMPRSIECCKVRGGNI